MYFTIPIVRIITAKLQANGSAKVNPKIALIGVGENNKFGHPSDKTMELLQSINCKIYRTDQMGEIIVQINKNSKYKIRTKIKSD